MPRVNGGVDKRRRRPRTAAVKAHVAGPARGDTTTSSDTSTDTAETGARHRAAARRARRSSDPSAAMEASVKGARSAVRRRPRAVLSSDDDEQFVEALGPRHSSADDAVRGASHKPSSPDAEGRDPKRARRRRSAPAPQLQLTLAPTSDCSGAPPSQAKSSLPTATSRRQTTLNGLLEVSEGAKRNRASGGGAQQTYIDKYRPKTVDEVAVHRRKVEEVQAWLLEAACWSQTLKHQRSVASTFPKLLILYGSSGVGKSTLVEILCGELGLNVRQWSDTGNSGGTRLGALSYAQATSTASGVGGGLDGDHFEFAAPFVSNLDDFRDFMLRSAIFPSLALTVVSDDASAGNGGQLGAHGAESQDAGDLLLIQELPKVHDDVGKERMQEILSQYLRYGRFPAVLVATTGDRADESAHEAALARLLSSEVVRSPSTRLLKVNPVNFTLMRKLLRRVAERESLLLTSDHLDSIARSSAGDIRTALNTLQFYGMAPQLLVVEPGRAKESKGPRSLKRRPRNLLEDEMGTAAQSGIACGRDDFLDNLHTLGKLLYAKRDESGRLEFDPDSLVAASSLDASSTAAFLSENAVEFFEDVDDLARAAELFSDAAVWSGSHARGKRKNDTSLASFPDDSVAALVGRISAETNLHPAPRTFRPLQKPASFWVEATRRENWRMVPDIVSSLPGTMRVRCAVSSHATQLLPAAARIFRRGTGNRAGVRNEASATAGASLDPRSAALLAALSTYTRSASGSNRWKVGSMVDGGEARVGSWAAAAAPFPVRGAATERGAGSGNGGLPEVQSDIESASEDEAPLSRSAAGLGAVGAGDAAEDEFAAEFGDGAELQAAPEAEALVSAATEAQGTVGAAGAVEDEFAADFGDGAELHELPDF